MAEEKVLWREKKKKAEPLLVRFLFWFSGFYDIIL